MDVHADKKTYHEEFVFDAEVVSTDDQPIYDFDILKNYTESISGAANKNCLDSDFLHAMASKMLESEDNSEPDFDQFTEDFVDSINAMENGTINQRVNTALEQDRNSLADYEL